MYITQIGNSLFGVVRDSFDGEQVMFEGSLSECIDWTNAHTYLGSEC